MCLTLAYYAFKRVFQIRSCDRCRICSKFLGGSLSHYITASASAVRPHVEHIVRAFQHIEVMLYDYHGVTAVHQLLKHAQKHLDILKMQASGRLVEYIRVFPVSFR